MCNFYPSIPFIAELLERNTYFAQTYRRNRMSFLKKVTPAKLLKGQDVAKESAKGMVALKLKVKREVFVVSSKLSAELLPTGKKYRKGNDVEKL